MSEKIENLSHQKRSDNRRNAYGGLGKFYQLFGDQYLEIIDELNPNHAVEIF